MNKSFEEKFINREKYVIKIICDIDKQLLEKETVVYHPETLPLNIVSFIRKYYENKGIGFEHVNVNGSLVLIVSRYTFNGDFEKALVYGREHNGEFKSEVNP